MTSDRATLHQFQELTLSTVTLSNNSTIQVTGQGDIHSHIVINQCCVTITLTNVLYIPQLCKSLILPNRITKMGYVVLQD
ncbi:uncharacterized protein ACA1_254000 [Acanthamoeba castellanii str. Neff]|jgi:hypothetical protein|uniref:Retrovirus-related Pol polyprotein from transposon TNT 1-94-like beta-barrel domain-containing protein n=1 Tax=Acanthamoeba castellanii (strain ATCC 30010 / Neff) TaxID=1257118 RepID=L8HCA1_ACACF|nr:uncharacterized protein ACA1_254000 [Acanthamoeba castellanii str. Neff]ELR22383.1 hypothetical protein ACA1_254000 [Acanthamoeba castellanii str. Neff]